MSHTKTSGRKAISPRNKEHIPLQPAKRVTTRRMYSKLLLKSDDLRLVLIAMDTGARGKQYHAEGGISIHALEGARVSTCRHRICIQGGYLSWHPVSSMTLKLTQPLRSCPRFHGPAAEIYNPCRTEGTAPDLVVRDNGTNLHRRAVENGSLPGDAQ